MYLFFIVPHHDEEAQHQGAGKLRAHSLNHKQKAKEVNWIRGETIIIQSLSPVMYFFLSLLILSETMPPTENQVFRYKSLLGYSHSGHHNIMHLAVELIGFVLLGVFYQNQVFRLYQIGFLFVCLFHSCYPLLLEIR